MDNRDEELFNGIIDVPNTPNQNSNISSNDNNLEYNFNFETQVNPEPAVQQTVNQNYVNPTPASNNYQTVNNPTPELNQNIESAPEVLDVNAEQPLTQVNTINREKLESLNNDTDNLIHPSMVINPSMNSPKEQPEVLNVEEPKVDYKEIKEKKNYAFMFIIFAIIILFIIFLPTIAKLIGI